MSNRINMVLTIFQLLIAFGALVLIELTHEKMGVARHLSYMNQKVQAVFQFEHLAMILGIVLIVLSVVFLIKLLKARNFALSNFVFLVYTLFAAGFILRNNVESEVAYYYVSLLMLIIIGIQIAKVFFLENDSFDNNSLSNRVINVILLMICFLIFAN